MNLTQWLACARPTLVYHLAKGHSRNYPGGAHFFQTPPPPGHTWSQSPPTLKTRVLITPHPTMDQIHLDPQDKLHPSDTLSTKHPSPPRIGQKSACGPPPRIISGTALTALEDILTFRPHLSWQCSALWEELIFEQTSSHKHLRLDSVSFRSHSNNVAASAPRVKLSCAWT